MHGTQGSHPGHGGGCGAGLGENGGTMCKLSDFVQPYKYSRNEPARERPDPGVPTSRSRGWQGI
eukprot:4441097-Prymnesium_polylepis.1